MATYTASFVFRTRKSSIPIFRVVTLQAPSEADFLNAIYDKHGKGSWEFRVTSCKCIA